MLQFCVTYHYYFIIIILIILNTKGDEKMAKRETINTRCSVETKERVENIRELSNNEVSVEMIIIHGLEYYEQIYNSNSARLIKLEKREKELKEQLENVGNALNKTRALVEKEKAQTHLNLDDINVIDSFNKIKEEYESYIQDKNKNHGFDKLFDSFTYNRSSTIEMIVRREYELKDIKLECYFRYFKRWYKEQ